MKQLPQESGRTGKRIWRRVEQIFTVYALLFCTGAFATMFSHDPPMSDEKPANAAMAAIQKQASAQSNDPTKANPIGLAGQISVYIVVAGLLIRNRRDALLKIRNSQVLWIFIGFAFLSVLWSDVPGWAFRRCINLTATCGFGLYLGSRYSPRHLLRLLGWTLLVAAVCSIVVVAVMPDRGLDSAATNHAWKGIFVQKNTLGRLMALGVVVFSFLAFENRAHRWRYGAAVLLCTGMIVGARSATSAMAVPILLILTGFFALCRRRSPWLVFPSALIGLTGFACAVMLVVDAHDLLSLLGRDATLSGRLEIWSAVLPKVMERPWLGYGYSSFWLGLESKSSADVWSILGWHVPHSHNGFLDLAAELGVVGLGLFFIGFFVTMKYGLRWARSQRTIIGLWPLAYLSFMFLFNLSESSLLKQDNIFWALYVATTVFVMNQARSAQSEVSKAPVRELRESVVA